MQSVAPTLNPNLSHPADDPETWRRSASSVFQNDTLVARLTLAELENALDRARKEREHRAATADSLTAFLETHLAANYLASRPTSQHLEIGVRRLAAETAMRDALDLTVAGLERAVEWRKANKLKE